MLYQHAMKPKKTLKIGTSETLDFVEPESIAVGTGLKRSDQVAYHGRELRKIFPHTLRIENIN